MFTSLTAALVMQAAVGGLAIGIASAQSADELCVAMPSPGLPTGAVVTLVQPTEPQSVLTVMVERPAATCEDLAAAMVPGPYYRARPIGPTAADPAALWVAFAGQLSSREIAPGTVAVSLGTAAPAMQVRSCTSGEGIHLTAWSGTPLESRRLWHAYYYLGYSVEPSCEEADTRPSGG